MKTAKNARWSRTKIRGTKPAKWANAQFPKAYSPPYKPGTHVVDIESDDTLTFVRVLSDNRKTLGGRWMMRRSVIEGLTPEQIADKFALDYVPTRITSITPPPGMRIRVGEVNANFGRPVAAFHKDHVFPLAGIRELKGFNNLSPHQQASLLTDPKNYQPMLGSMNCSKGCRVVGTANDWKTYKGQPLNEGYRDWLKRAQNDMIEHFEKRIKHMSGD